MKIFILSTLLLSVLITTGQSINEVVYSTLGTTLGRNSNTMIKTDYGSFTFKLKAGNGVCDKIILTLTNGQYNYDEIIENSKDYEIQVGTLWTDLIFTFTPIKSKKFKSLNEAEEYYNSIDKTKYKICNELHIYKQDNKEKYLVGIFNNEFPEYGELIRVDSNGKKLGKDYQVVK